MTERIPLSIDRQASRAVRDVVLATAASLPMSFLAVSGRGEAVAVDGRGDWSERARVAVDEGARGVLVVAPGVAGAGSAARLADAGVPIVLDAPWRHAVLLTRMAPDFRATRSHRTMLEARTTVALPSELADAVADLAFSARALLGSTLSSRRTPIVSERQVITVWTPSPGFLVRLSATVSPEPPGRAWFRLIGERQTVTLELPSPGSGDSGIGELITADGTTSAPSVFESSHRAALVRLERAMSGDVVSTDVIDYLSATADDAAID
ncbi:hypothetical protein [uncultured Amnibacterium sp.]|uniref:hypothetical protein n=1 Tax=uncultured Amnibacterium sp. TaxID=1631851 RepID=UPI0035CC0204